MGNEAYLRVREPLVFPSKAYALVTTATAAFHMWCMSPSTFASPILERTGLE